MLEPIWSTKPEVARKVRMRVGQVLNFSYSKGWRAAEAPGRSVTMGLTKQPRGKNFKSMPYPAVPAFLQDILDKPPTAGRRALALQILTAARPGEIRAARWEQFDLKKGDWLRPATIMKSGEAHTVTLNRQAVAVLLALREQAPGEPEDLVFPGRKGRPMSDMTMRKVMKDAGLKFDPHGFRASFRNWVAEQTDSPDPVAESALAHLVPDKVVRAYKTTNFIDMRRKLLEAWGAFISGEIQKAGNEHALTLHRPRCPPEAPMSDRSNSQPASFSEAPRCQAKTRPGRSCRSPAVRGKRVCKMHGGLSPGAPKGEANGRWKNGAWTLEARALRAEATRLLKAIGDPT